MSSRQLQLQWVLLALWVSLTIQYRGLRLRLSKGRATRAVYSKLWGKARNAGDEWVEPPRPARPATSATRGAERPALGMARSKNFKEVRIRRDAADGSSEERGGGGSATDPWKVLIKKLDTTKSAKESFGKVEKVLIKGPDELQCRHFDTCAGCSMQGNFSLAPTVQRARLFFASESVALKVHTGQHLAWRTHVKLAVQPLSRWGGLRFGLYREGTHEVEAIPDCRVHHPRINLAVEELRVAATESGVKGYQEGKPGAAPEGELRYAQMSLERESGKVQLVLVWNVATYKDAEQSLARLVKKLKGNPSLWHSVTVNFQTSEGNAIFNVNPKQWKLLWGPPVLREKIGETFFFFRPQIFRQANLELFSSGIVPLVVKSVPEGSKVSELYSGIGVLGLNVAAAGRSEVVLCSDSNEYVDEVFDRCADALPEAHRENVFYEVLPAEEAVVEGQCDDAEVLIVDPPRKGLDEGVMQLLLDKHPSASAPELKRLIYVSCGFDALEKDTRALLESQKWTLRSADGFVLFPGSDHVETVCVFDRRTAPGAGSSH